MAVLKLTSFGDSTVIVIPPEMLEHLKVCEGDELIAIESLAVTCLQPMIWKHIAN